MNISKYGEYIINFFVSMVIAYITMEYSKELIGLGETLCLTIYTITFHITFTYINKE